MYLVKERREIQEVYLAYISYIEEHLDDGCNYLCHMDMDLEKCDRFGKPIVGGWNDRMILNAVEYLKTERPSKTLNKSIYNKPMFRKDKNLSNNDPWWLVAKTGWDEPEDECAITNTACNREKIEFLQHLIKKLR